MKNKCFLPSFGKVGSNFKIEYPFYIIGSENIFIGDNFTSRKGIKLRAFTQFNDQSFSPAIKIGNDVSFETDCHIGCINYISIGDNCLIASGVFISDHMHGQEDYSDYEIPPLKRKLTSKGPVIIEDNVWIGERAVILSGVKIGRNSIIGANAVVLNDIPPMSIAAGVPAKIIKVIS